jgi:hypothetical protein
LSQLFASTIQVAYWFYSLQQYQLLMVMKLSHIQARAADSVLIEFAAAHRTRWGSFALDKHHLQSAVEAQADFTPWTVIVCALDTSAISITELSQTGVRHCSSLPRSLRVCPRTEGSVQDGFGAIGGKRMIRVKARLANPQLGYSVFQN